MRIKYFILSFLIVISDQINAQSGKIHGCPDSLLINIQNKNQAFFLHKVSKNQTLFSISQFYNISILELLSANQEHADGTINEFTTLKIPVTPNQITDKKLLSSNNLVPVYYIVNAKDNLFSICKRSFDFPIARIRQLNKLENNSLKAGQELLIGYYQIHLNIASEHVSNAQMELDETITEKFTHTSRGIAICESKGLGEGRFFALHNTATMESYIEIMNPILNRSILAKVIGRIPPIYEKDVQVIVSAEVGRQLSIFNKRFFVQLNYK
ncbi:MAG: LysM peptidoglycan-binding domain-containing protein [Saprospiraceae bacterium]|nr:LysM peptidoglycan-binding domain-containing protein [Saprospiraceae bacterium]MBK9721564.1 LysM peptidoglycan-binding domain-containing protein [Saprospiraceae bacterium]